MATSATDALFTQRMIWLGLFTAVGIYGVIAYVTPMQGAAMTDLTMAYALCGIAGMETLLLPMLRRRMLPADPASDGGSPVAAPASSQPAIVRLATAQIVTWAICESMAILGLVLVFVMHDMRWLYGLGGLALVNLFIYRPTIELVEAALRGP